jgi:putative ABC transport system permease protein
MVSHYLKSVFKSIKKSGKVSTFNLIGLSVSFAAFILLSVYLQKEFTFDQYNEHHSDVYRLNLKYTDDGVTREVCFLPNPMADLIAENLPEVVAMNSFAWGPGVFSLEGVPEKPYQLSTKAVDSTFNQVFSLNIINGTQNPLIEKRHIMLSQSAATKIFGNENPIGKTIMANFSTPYIIDAVYEDLPVNSSFKFDAFTSYPSGGWVDDWSEYSFNHYFRFSPNPDFEQIRKKIAEIPRFKEMAEEGYGREYDFTFTPLKDMHFDPNYGQGNLTFAKTLVMVAILLILMAFINYINFAIANTPKIIKTANMRRVVGATKKGIYLINAFESTVIISISFILAFIIALLTLKFWPDIFGYEVNLIEDYKLLLLEFISFITLGAFISLIPSRLVVNVKPAMALKGMITYSANRGISGKVLTVVQYSISIILIIGILFINKQISFLKNYDLGFNKENIVVVEMTGALMEQENSFAQELLSHPGITDYAYSQFVPGGVGMSWGRVIDGKNVSFFSWPVDERYLNFMGLEIIEGRNFSDNIEADENNFIFNKKALSEFGWTENYLGKEIPGFDFTGKIVGIVDDLKYASLHEEVKPLAFWLTKTRHNVISLKIESGQTRSALEHIRQIHDKFEKNYSLSYSFLDDRLDKLYKSEERQAKLIFTFCIVSIIISIVGALGLIIFMCEYRIKEIGIRKVNGATIGQIIKMLNWSFLKWIVLSFVIAVPIAFYLLQSWLSEFAFRTSLSWWVFATGGIIAFAVAILTVTWQSWKAAKNNPVKALRYE